MRKGKFINTSILLACLSTRKTKPEVQEVNIFLNQAVKQISEKIAAGKSVLQPGK